PAGNFQVPPPISTSALASAWPSMRRLGPPSPATVNVCLAPRLRRGAGPACRRGASEAGLRRRAGRRYEGGRLGGACMDRLILFRHGKAEPESASGDDFDRRLAP